jgi:hypothetical protein
MIGLLGPDHAACGPYGGVLARSVAARAVQLVT